MLTFGLSLSGGGTSITSSQARIADGLGERSVALPVGNAGTLSTRTDASTGEITAADAEHGIATGDAVDIYWDGGVRYGATVGTVAGAAIPVSGGAGDDLPLADAAVVVTKQVPINADIDGDELVILGIAAIYVSPTSAGKAHVDLRDAANATIEELDLPANSPQIYDVAGGQTNPFAGNPIAKLLASNGSATEPATLKLLWLADSTP